MPGCEHRKLVENLAGSFSFIPQDAKNYPGPKGIRMRKSAFYASKPVGCQLHLFSRSEFCLHFDISQVGLPSKLKKGRHVSMPPILQDLMVLLAG